jgi:hypothetical protein
MTDLTAALLQRGLPKHVAQAFAANAQDESGMRTDINEIKPIVPGSRGGYGLLQWTGPRRRQLEAFAQERGLPVSDMNVQADFLMHELSGTEKRAAKRIFATDNPADAAVSIMNDFLRPHKSHRPKREARYRQMFSDGISGGAGTDTLIGGASQDMLFQEAVRRGLIDQSELQAEAERRGLLGPTQQERVAAEGPDPRDRADVEAALGQMAVDQSGLPEKGLIEGAFDEFTSGVAGNFGDNLEAIERAIPALFNDDNFLEQYQIALSEERERSAKFSEKNPVLATGSNIAGAVATGVGAAKNGLSLVGATKTVPGAAAAGAGEGAIYGTIWGAGAAEGDLENIATEALESGAAGALLGGVITGGLQRIANGRVRGAAMKALKPTADLKAARDDAYQAVSNLGASYRSQAVDDLVARMEKQLQSRAFNSELHKGASAALQYAQSLRGKALSLTELDQLRQVVSRDAGGSMLPADKSFGASMVDQIDSFIERTVPTSGANGQKVNVRAVSGAIREARKAHTQFRKAELIDSILLEAADQAASTGSGGNVNNVIRQRFKSLLKNKKQIKFFSSDEIGAMRRIVRGSAKDNTLRLVGKLSPGGNGLMTALNLGAVAVNPAALTVSAGASAAKAIADKGTMKAVDGLRATVQTGRDVSRDAVEITAQKRALFRTLAAEFGIDLTSEGPKPQKTPVQ